jgi:hypothetical protein
MFREHAGERERRARVGAVGPEVDRRGDYFTF